MTQITTTGDYQQNAVAEQLNALLVIAETSAGKSAGIPKFLPDGDWHRDQTIFYFNKFMRFLIDETSLTLTGTYVNLGDYTNPFDQNISLHINAAAIHLEGGTLVIGNKWALVLDGANDHLLMDIWKPLADYSIKGTYTYASDKMLMGSIASASDWMYSTTAGLEIRMGGTQVTLVIPDIIVGDLVEFEMTYIGTTLTITANGATYQQVTSTPFILGFDTFGRYNGAGYYFNGNFQGLWTFTADNLPTRTYDFEASGEAKTGTGQPIVIDTTSGLNAVGVNFTGNDSEWTNMKPEVVATYIWDAKGSYTSPNEWQSFSGTSYLCNNVTSDGTVVNPPTDIWSKTAIVTVGDNDPETVTFKDTSTQSGGGFQVVWDGMTVKDGITFKIEVLG
ncbi:hypothetical protein COPG_00040 [Colwellia phage 9A]|uniref:Uncharacterized protein n=1 Tax=Colwellia phage 9A TaxID=765765 RepID=I3UMC1_9CAUD|nr:hypothetical protein COPG_00040 [Colwellia phage 9A]AFK66636.1 hypothetical protein COPG_00040 [Colwellia phage 9A]